MLSLLLSFFIHQASASEPIYLRNQTIESTTAQSTKLWLKPSWTSLRQSIFIMQFANEITAQDLQHLKAERIKVLGYIPEHSLLVQIKNKKSFVKAVSTEVVGLLPFTEDFKLEKELQTVSIFDKDRFEKIALRTLGKEFNSKIQARIDDLGGHISVSSGKNIEAYLTKKNILELAKTEGIDYIERAAKIELMNVPYSDLLDSVQIQTAGDFTDLSGYESGTKIMGFESAWQAGFNGKGQFVAMGDTGVDTGDKNTLFPDLANVSKGYILGLYSKSWQDKMGHGTHVAGSIIGNGTGSHNLITGGAIGAQLIVESLWSDMMKNLIVPAPLTKLFDPAYADGARIHSNSWGSPASSAYDSIAIQVDEYVWQHPEFLPVFAAGNGGVDENKDGRVDDGSISSPSTAKNVLTVGASENYVMTGGIQKDIKDLAKGAWSQDPLGDDKLSDNPNGIAVFSSRGPLTDGRTKPDIVAPGTNILSNCSHVPKAEKLWGPYNDDYCFSGGTSMATPLTAGAAAVTRQFLVESKGQKTPSAALVKATMLYTAQDLYPGQFGNVGKSAGQELLSYAPNSQEGFGRVDMNALTTQKFEVVDFKAGLKAGQSQVYHYESKGGSQLHFNLVYSDAPGLASAGKALVNDLNLEVKLADGKVLSFKDATNNYETGYIDLKGNSSFDITVKGDRVTNGPQPFALVVGEVN